MDAVWVRCARGDVLWLLLYLSTDQRRPSRGTATQVARATSRLFPSRVRLSPNPLVSPAAFVSLFLLAWLAHVPDTGSVLDLVATTHPGLCASRRVASDTDGDIRLV